MLSFLVFRCHFFESLHTDLLMTSLIMRLAIAHITYNHFRYCIKRTLILGKVYECISGWHGQGIDENKSDMLSENGLRRFIIT